MKKTAMTGEHITPIDVLTDEAVDKILAGEMAAPRYEPWVTTRGGNVRAKRACSICGKAGHNRREHG